MLTMLDILALLDEGRPVGIGENTRTEESDFQRHVLLRVTDPCLKQWFDSFLAWPRHVRAEVAGPIHWLIGAYVLDRRALVIMGQRRSTMMFSDVLSEGMVLLVSTAQGAIGTAPAALMGEAMVSLLESALGDRKSLDPSLRAKCPLVCDEFPTVTGVDWEGMLSEIRKYGCSLMLATQSLGRLDTPGRKLKAGILGNMGCIFGYQMSAEDARLVSAEMDSERVPDRDLVNLDPHTCFVRMNSDSKCYPVFSMMTLVPPDTKRGAEQSVAAVIAAFESYTVDAAVARLAF